MNKINILLCIVLLLSMAGCKDPYDMELRSSDRSLLVVEGFLNLGATSNFRLSRTISLSEKTQLKPELRAVLTVEGKDNTAAPFAEKGNGSYTADLVHLQVGKEYRLRIRTADGKEYLSDYVTVKDTPPVDSINWRQDDEGIHVSVSTHDPDNDTRYYRWDFEETWEIRSFFISQYKFTGDTVLPRDMATEDVSKCWKTAPSTTILLGSSAKLVEDVIKESPITTVDRMSEKMAHRYSILVKQYALSKEAYEYLELMKKNTEKLGSIFDPQPSEIRGNIHCVNDPEEPVIGYITASAVQEKRHFISPLELTGRGFTMSCEVVEVPNNRADLKAAFSSGALVPYEAIMPPTSALIIIAYTASSAHCVDCTSRGGTTQKPSFW